MCASLARSLFIDTPNYRFQRHLRSACHSKRPKRIRLITDRITNITDIEYADFVKTDSQLSTSLSLLLSVSSGRCRRRFRPFPIVPRFGFAVVIRRFVAAPGALINAFLIAPSSPSDIVFRLSQPPQTVRKHQL
jgi:hypothetical protein